MQDDDHTLPVRCRCSRCRSSGASHYVAFRLARPSHHGAWRFHTGIDLGYDYGTPIPAMFDGIVLAAGDFGDGYGNQVVLYHPAYDTYTRYAHMQSISVAVDTFVPQGAILGFVGSTGNATGPHLHWEYIVRAADGGYTYTDPIVLWQ